MCELEQVLDAIRSIRCPAVCEEARLHDLVLSALQSAGLRAKHEATLAPRCRIDILCGGVGIEIKKKRPQAAALKRQLERYAACEQIEELLVIAPRGVNLPTKIGGKCVIMFALERLWGISLP